MATCKESSLCALRRPVRRSGRPLPPSVECGAECGPKAIRSHSTDRPTLHTWLGGSGRLTTEAVTSEAMTSDATTGDAMMGAFGAACSAVPADGPGSFKGMAEAPAATAASANPLLSTLVAAVTAAGLGDTLNGPGPFTIFAPTNDAFAKIDKDTLAKLLADPTGDLTKILTFHVVPGKALKAAQDVTINGTSKVLCGDVPVANGIVHVIDTVLTPS